MLEIPSRCGGSTGTRKAGQRKLAAVTTAHAPDENLADSISAALHQQTVTVPGTTAVDTVAVDTVLPDSSAA